MGTKILFINTEVSPYMPDSRMSVMGRTLPHAIQERGGEIRLFMPHFGQINKRRHQLHEVIRLSGMNLIINETDHPLIIKVASMQNVRMQVFFIDNDDYFTQRGKYGEEGESEYKDNAERCAFFARGVIETIRKQRWVPDVVYCQGWFSAITPLYIKKAFAEDPCFRGVKVVFGLFAEPFSRPMPESFVKTVLCEGITKADLGDVAGKQVSYTDLCRLAVRYSDALVISEEGADEAVVEYARELNLPVLDATEEGVDGDKYDAFFKMLSPEEEPND